MNGLNKVIIMGNLGADPDLRIAAGGLAVLKMRVATGERWQDKDRNWQERTEWHRVTVFGKRAEALAKVLKKGMFITIDGENRTSSYEKAGQKHYSTEVVAHAIWSPDIARSGVTMAPGEEAPFAPPTSLQSAFARTPVAAVDIPF
jgi:single-strand DNA-binding protein